MDKLSPEAQAILDAWHRRSLNAREWNDELGPRLKLAAALCALADILEGGPSWCRIMEIANELDPLEYEEKETGDAE